MARLKDKKLNGVSVVLDDPVNSFGQTISGLIKQTIRNIYKEGAQVIVLTHDLRLAAMIWRDAEINRDHIKCLSVISTGESSNIDNWDIEKAIQTKYVQNYLRLIHFIEHGGDHNNAAQAIRPYLEQRLRYLYPGSTFTERDSLGAMIKKIKDCSPGDRLHALKETKLSELIAINDAVRTIPHGVEGDIGVTDMTPGTVRIYATKARDVL